MESTFHNDSKLEYLTNYINNKIYIKFKWFNNILINSYM